MGNHIADALIPLLQQDQESLKAKPQARQKENHKEDEPIFEEENDSSKDISSGYVVVRKKDLD